MRNGGQWSEARYQSFVKSALRAASRRWPPKFETLNDSYVDRRTNVKTGRPAKHFQCNTCKLLYPASEVQVDHIEPIIDPTTGFISWDLVIERMFCEKDNLQVLCIECHKIKTNAEKALAKERRNDDKSKD